MKVIKFLFNRTECTMPEDFAMKYFSTFVNNPLKDSLWFTLETKESAEKIWIGLYEFLEGPFGYSKEDLETWSYKMFPQEYNQALVDILTLKTKYIGPLTREEMTTVFEILNLSSCSRVLSGDIEYIEKITSLSTIEIIGAKKIIITNMILERMPESLKDLFINGLSIIDL